MDPLAKRTGTQHQALSSETKRVSWENRSRATGFLGRLLSGLLGPQPHGLFRYYDEASHPLPLSGTCGDALKVPPTRWSEHADSGLDLVHGLQRTAV